MHPALLRRILGLLNPNRIQPPTLAPPATPLPAAEMFVESVDMERRAISKDEFRELIMHMAAADLHSRRSQHAADDKGDWQMSSWEEDDQIVAKLKSWTDHLMMRRFK